MIKKVSFIIAALLFLLLAYLVVDFIRYTTNRNTLITTKGVETTNQLRDQVNGILHSIQQEGDRLATQLGSGDYTTSEIEKFIKESSLRIPALQGVTACYEPFAFDNKTRLYCPYYNKGSKDYLAVEDSYDYSVKSPSSVWYTSVRDEGSKWVEPYYAKAAQDWYVDYGAPFYYQSGPNKGKVRGTITMSFVSSGFKEMVHKLSIGKTGYGVITSAEGTFLAHPVDDYVGTKNIQEIAEKETNPSLQEAFRGIMNNEKGHVAFFDEAHKDNTLFYYDQIPISKWGIGLLFFKKDILGSSAIINKKYIRLAIVFAFFFICILAIYYNKDHLDEQEIWKLSMVSTALFISILFLVGYLKHNTHIKDSNESPPIVDITSLNSYINSQNLRLSTLKQEKLTPVPTGIYIERMEFADSYNVNMGAKVWQKYPLNIGKEISQGFHLPQLSPFAESSYIEETYRDTIEGLEGDTDYELVGWDVRVTLRLNLNYADYPFDEQHIDFQILPLNNNDRLLFTPDLSSYDYTNPSRKSGLDPNVNISGSEIYESYFNFSTQTYSTDFGYQNKSLFSEVPILHYNISLSRKLLNSFITYLIPISVTMVMVFILLLACGKTEERQGIIESMAAFFFVLVFSHIDLRREIITAELIYMEYFYFISYFMLILSTLNLIIYSKDKSAIFDHNENQVFKAIYFPLFFLLAMGITLYKFY